jgi:hypothetical protein
VGAIPHDLPKASTVRHYYDGFRSDRTWETIHGQPPRESKGVRGPSAHPRRRRHRQSIGEDDVRKGACPGDDAGKKVTGRKPHIAVDTMA